MTPAPDIQERRGGRWLLPPTLAVRLPLLVLGALVVIILATALSASAISRYRLEQVLHNDLRSLAVLQAEQVEQPLNQHLIRLESLAASAEVRDQAGIANNIYIALTADEISVLLEERESLWRAAQTAARISPQQSVLTNMVRFNTLSTGQLAAESRNLFTIAGMQADFVLTDRYGALVAASSLPPAYNHADRPWWRAVVDSTRPHVAGPTPPDSAGRRWLEFAIPVRAANSGATIGVLYSAVDFDLVSAAFRRLERTGTGQAILLAADPARPNAATALYANPRLGVLASQPFDVAAMAASLFDWSAAPGNDFVLATVPMQSDNQQISRLGWYVAALQNRDAALAPVEAAQRGSLLIAAAIGALTVLLLYFAYIRPLTSDLNALHAGAQALQSGRLDIQVPQRRSDELGDLAATFNEMARRLKAQIESREQTIRERTGRLQGQAERLKLSAEVGRAAGASLDPDRLLAEAVALIGQDGGPYEATLYLLDDDGPRLTARAASGEAGRKLLADGPGSALDIPSQVSACAACQEVQVEQAAVALPLLARGRLLGVLDVHCRNAIPPEEDEIAILRLMADQVASAILNALLFSQSESRARLLAELQGVTNVMNQQVTLRGALNALAQLGMPLLDSQASIVWLWQEDAGQLELAISHNVRPELAEARLATGEGLSGRAFAENKTFVIDDYQSWAGHAATFAGEAYRAALAVPLRRQEQVIGAFSLIRTLAGQPYSLEEVQVAELLAAQAGTVIVTTQLVEETRRLARRERVVNRIAAEIRRSLDTQTILETTTRELSQALGDRRVRVRLNLPDAGDPLPTADHQKEL